MRKLWVPSRSVVMPRLWFRQRGFFAPSALIPSRKVGAVDFDGTNDYMTTGAGLTGAADSTQCLASVWIRLDGGDTSNMRILCMANAVGGAVSALQMRLFRLIDNTINFFVSDAGTTNNAVTLKTNLTYTASATWLHILTSYQAASPNRFLYINDASDLAGSSTGTSGTSDFTGADWGVGATTDGSAKFNGAIAELYFAPGQYLDLSVEANRRKFITAEGKPAYLGTDGSKPTGIAPLIYLGIRKNEAAANFATNRGTGGNFSITGTLDYASSSPSD